MYTEEDLRATLSALEHEAPDAVGILAALARARRRRTVRRRVVGVVAVAVVAAVVAGGSVLVGNLADPSGVDTAAPPADPTLEGLRYPFAVDESAGFRVLYGASRFAGAATATIGDPATRSDVEYPYLLEVIGADGWAPPEGQAGEPVQVNGRTGFYREDFLYQYDTENTNGVPGVVWEYTPGAWAVLRYRPTEPEAVPLADVRETLLRIAEAVRFDQTAPVRMPFQVGHLPAGLHPGADFPADFNAGPSNVNASVSLVGNTGSLNIRMVEILDGMPAPGEMDVDETPDGITFVRMNLGQFVLDLSSETFSVDEMKKIAESISPAADLHDPNTWFDADKALPLR